MRNLHLLDVEYLGCGPSMRPGDLSLVLRRYRPLTRWHRGDIILGAASTYVYKRIAFDIPGDIRLVPAGAGADAADDRLIDEARHLDLTRYDRVVVGSGDGRFVAVLRQCSALGLQTCVAGYRFNMARVLVAEATEVVDLTAGYALAA